MKFFKYLSPVSAAAVAILTIIIISVCGFEMAYAASGTAVVGEISTDTDWVAAQSPYVVSGFVTIDAGATLSVEPGVVVKFRPGSGLNIFGGLKAIGTVASPIYFTSFADDKAGGDTNGDKNASIPLASDMWNINFLNASSSVISNAVVRYSSGGIFALHSPLSLDSTSFSFMDGQINVEQSNLTVKNVSFSTMNHGVTNIFGTSTALFSSVSVKNSGGDAISVYGNSIISAGQLSVSKETGGAGLAVFNSSSFSCDQCDFSDIANNFGPSVAVYSGSTLSFTNSSIKNATGTAATAFMLYDPEWELSSLSMNSQATFINTVLKGGKEGIQVFGPVKLTIANGTISDFTDDGIQAYSGANLNVFTTTISKNQNNGVEMWSKVSGSISYSYIVGNGQYGIMSRTDAPFAADSNWWGSASGPYHPLLNSGGTGNAVSDDVIFYPWRKSHSLQSNPPSGGSRGSHGLGRGGDPVDPPCCSSVLFIPGLEASRLYATTSTLLGKLTGGVKETQLWEPGLTTNVSKLFLNADGSTINSIYTKDIINKTNEIAANVDIYQDFSDTLQALVTSGTIKSWQAYPYDWRLDPKSLVENGTQLTSIVSKLEPAVAALARLSKTGKVTIVAHSNGGILAKLLINKLEADGKSNLIDMLALVAVPQLGTPIAIPALLSGYGQSLGWGFILSASTAQKLAENMPVAYTLLPSAAYFSVAGPAVLLDPSLDAISNLRQVYGSAISDATTLASFLTGTADNRTAGEQALLALANGNLLPQASSTHADLDSWQAPVGMRVVQIAGVGLNTLSASRYYAKNSSSNIDMSPQFTQLGDNTVVAASAIATSSSSADYYVDLAGYNSSSKQNRGHSDILETKPVEQLLTGLVKGTVTASSSLTTLPQFVSTAIPAAYLASSSMEEISVHSPVVLNVYDTEGRHTGPVTNGGDASSSVTFIQNQIPNSYYMSFGEGQYVGVPVTTKGNIVLLGTAVGTFTLDITVNGTTTEFSDIPISPTSTVLVPLGTTTPTVTVDFDGDGVPDAAFSTSTELNRRDD